jgi:dUTP pyrophosphatase
MDKIVVKIVNKGKQKLPVYETEKSAGLDLRADINEVIVLEPLQRQLIHTGLCIALPDGYEANVRPRSGLALKHGITVLNTPGTIDADYRGEIGIVLANMSNKPYYINPGDRIAQLVINPVVQAEFDVVSALDRTERGAGGFGHTGVK